MKPMVRLFIPLILLLTSFFTYAANKEISLEELTAKVSTRNLSVLENALKVYQTKEGIAAARNNLLPRLNVWKLAAVAVDWVSIIGVVEDIAPFLVPANWFRVKEAKLLYRAQAEGYQALWANEIMTTRALYYQVLLDEQLLKLIEVMIADLDEYSVIAKSREAFGALPVGYALELESKKLALIEDKRVLQVLLREELSNLAYALGMDAKEEITLKAIGFPDFQTLQPLNYADFEYRTLSTSPELKVFSHLLQVTQWMKKEVYFSFLGTSTMSRGVSGGVFDSIPIQNGLGFSAGASIAIIKAQNDILTHQKQGVFETLKRQLKVLTDVYNLDVENYNNLKKRDQLANTIYASIREKFLLGENIDLLRLQDSLNARVQSKIALVSSQFRFIKNEDKLARLIFHGEYKGGLAK